MDGSERVGKGNIQTENSKALLCVSTFTSKHPFGEILLVFGFYCLFTSIAHSLPAHKMSD